MKRKNLSLLKRAEKEHIVSRLKMLTAIEAEIKDDILLIQASELSLKELDGLVKFCNRSGLEYSLESYMIFKIY